MEGFYSNKPATRKVFTEINLPYGRTFENIPCGRQLDNISDMLQSTLDWACQQVNFWISV